MKQDLIERFKKGDVLTAVELNRIRDHITPHSHQPLSYQSGGQSLRRNALTDPTPLIQYAVAKGIHEAGDNKTLQAVTLRDYYPTGGFLDSGEDIEARDIYGAGTFTGDHLKIIQLAPSGEFGFYLLDFHRFFKPQTTINLGERGGSETVDIWPALFGDDTGAIGTLKVYFDGIVGNRSDPIAVDVHCKCRFEMHSKGGYSDGENQQMGVWRMVEANCNP